MSLDEILQKHFGCKKVFLQKRRIVGYWADGEPDHEYMTRAGGKAYGNLVSLVYDLELLLGGDFDANKIITELDSIVSSEPN